MSQVITLELPDDVYKAIERAAELTGQKPAEWVSMKLRQQLSAPLKGSPDAILEAMHGPPHLTPSDVESLEESIATGKLPVKWEPAISDYRRDTGRCQPADPIATGAPHQETGGAPGEIWRAT